MEIDDEKKKSLTEIERNVNMKFILVSHFSVPEFNLTKK